MNTKSFWNLFMELSVAHRKIKLIQKYNQNVLM